MTIQDTPLLSEEEEDRLPVLLPVIEATGSRGARLYLGNRVAADDANLLLAHDITSTMNLAVNTELLPLMLPDGTHVRRTHIGLIDGPGNAPQHLLAAVMAIAGIVEQASPGKSHYPPHRAGNILVHCRGGRSRSVTVIALYLLLFHGERFPRLEDTLGHLRQIRGLDETQPQKAMVALAQRLLEKLDQTRSARGSLSWG